MLYKICSFLAFVLLKLLLKLETIGKDNIPKCGGFILASNHVSYLDPITIGAVSFRKLNFMARHDLFSNPFSSWFLRKVGAFPIKRRSADLSGLKEAMRRVKKGEGLVIFPEGSRDKGLKDTHSGIGFLAAKLSVPVVPAFIKGSDIALPRGAKVIKRIKVSISFGKQIFIERGLPYHDIAKEIMDNIRHLSCEDLN